MSIKLDNLSSLTLTVATDSTKLPLTGGTMSGPIQNIVSNTPTELLGNVRVGGTLLLDYGNAFGITGTNTLLSETELRVSTSESTDYVSLTVGGLRFADGTIQTTAATGSGDYLPIAGGIMSGAIRFDEVGTQNIAKGSFDSGRGGYNGISLTCAVEYELNWQAGYLKALNSGGFTVPINVESDIVNTSIPDEGGNYNATALHSDGIYILNNIDGSASFNLNGVSGTPTGGPTWGLGVSGCGGDNDDGLSWGITPSYSAGNFINENWWGIGFNGIEVGKVDDVTNPQLDYNNNTAQLTISTSEPIEGSEFPRITSSTISNNGISCYYRDEYEQSSNISFSNGVVKTGNLGGNFSLTGENGLVFDDSFHASLNSNGLIIGNLNDTYIGVNTEEIRFNDGSTQIIAYNPSVNNSELSQSGNIAHSDYPLEIHLTINGTTYAVPAREV